MPRITRLFIKSGMIYFLAGIILALIAELPDVSTRKLLSSVYLRMLVYWHMSVLGWITQVIMGVSIWMFPRKQRGKRKEETFAANAAFWCLNIGLVLRFLAEPFLPFYFNESWIVLVIVLSSILQITAIGFYTAEIWPRVRPRPVRKGKPKKAKG